jgi:hypothetical protein
MDDPSNCAFHVYPINRLPVAFKVAAMSQQEGICQLRTALEFHRAVGGVVDQQAALWMVV